MSDEKNLTKFYVAYSYAFDDWCVIESSAKNPNEVFRFGGADTAYDTLEEANAAFHAFNERRRLARGR